MTSKAEYWKRKMMWDNARTRYHYKRYDKSIEKQWEKIKNVKTRT